MKFRSENLLENGNGNKSLHHLSFRKDDEDCFSPKLRVRIKDNNNSPHGKFRVSLHATW